MATVTRLYLTFTRNNDTTMSVSYNYVKNDISVENVKALMEGIVANGDIFERTPAAIKGARIVTTEETVFDLD